MLQSEQEIMWTIEYYNRLCFHTNGIVWDKRKSLMVTTRFILFRNK